MSERPGSFALAKESAEFVFSNMGVLIHQVKAIFALMLLLSFIDILCEVYEIKYVPFATGVFNIYLYGCFALIWHRYSLSGTHPPYPMNPFTLGREDFKFIGLFFILAIFPVVIGIGVGAIIGGAQLTNSAPVVAISALIAIPAFIYAFLVMLRYSFKLPAKSLGVDLSMAEAKRASRGMISRILIAGFIIGCGTMIVLLIYSLLAGISVGFAAGDGDPGDVAKIVMGFILGAPVLAMVVVVMAINVTVLSKAYQWGIQNNTIS